VTEVAAPSSDALGALGSDGWAQVLVAAKRLAARQDPEQDPELATLVALPTSRLVGGKARRRLTRHLADPRRWSLVVAGLPDDGSIAPDLQALLARPADGTASRASAGSDEPPRPGPPSAAAGDPAAAAKSRAREARADRDRWQRRAEGAEARISALQAQLDAREGDLARLRDRLAALEAQLEAGATDRARAVEREGRRRDAELERLRSELAELRRRDEQRRIEQRQRTERREQLAAEERRRGVAEQDTDDRHDVRFVPGRPSTLPAGVQPGTTEAARLLLHPGRRVIVDGYNVTLQHQPGLELEQQRSWLVAQLGNLVARRRVDVTVVFDGEQPGGGRPAAGARGVLVRFTGAGITADDEIVLDVEATDEPVTVVTDDRELTGRVSTSGADVIGTRSLLGVTA
jgi:hypothetical protein